LFAANFGLKMPKLDHIFAQVVSCSACKPCSVNKHFQNVNRETRAFVLNAQTQQSVTEMEKYENTRCFNFFSQEVSNAN